MRVRIDHPSPHVIRFEASRRHALTVAGVLLLAILVYVWFVSGRPTPHDLIDLASLRRWPGERFWFWFAVHAAITSPFLYFMMQAAIVAAFGHTIVFDRAQHVVTRNGKVVATVTQITGIQLDYIETRVNSGVWARLLLRDGEEKLGRLCSQEQIWSFIDGRQVIDEVAAFGKLSGNILQDIEPK